MTRYTEKEEVLILKLLAYFKQEKEAGKPLLPVTAVHEGVTQALDISLPTSSRLGVQKDASFSAQECLAKVAGRGRPIHEVHENVIRSRTYMMYSEGLHVTLSTLNEQLGELDEVKILLSSLRNLDVRSALL